MKGVIITSKPVSGKPVWFTWPRVYRADGFNIWFGKWIINIRKIDA